VKTGRHGRSLRLRLRLGFRLRLRSWRRWRRRSRCGRRRRVVVATACEHETGTQEHGKKEKIFITDVT